MTGVDSIVADCPYYHGLMSRNEAVTYLKNRDEGSFLLRKSPNKSDGSFAISVMSNSKVIHYSIERVSDNEFRINKASIHETPCAVVEHYIHTKGGLKCQLIYPVLNKIIQNFNPSAKKDMDTYIDLVNDELNNNQIELNRPNIRSAAWFHGPITRDEDTRRLTECYKASKQNGMFLVREKDAEKYVLSVINNGNLHRYMILKSDDNLYIDGKEKELYSSLNELIEQHVNFPTNVTGIKCQLTTPCPIPEPNKPKKNNRQEKSKVVAKELSNITPQNLLDLNWSKSNNAKSRNNSTTSNESPKSNENFTNKSERIVLKRFQQSFKKKSLPNESLGFLSPYCNNKTEIEFPKEIYVPKENISIYEQLGSGHFGAVHLGRCVIKGQGIPCAVKFLSGDDMEMNKSEIIVEAKIMQKLDHPHIVRLFGICETDDLKIIMELAPLGTLQSCLKNQCKFTQSQLVLLLKQVSDGMDYLAKQNVVHRDLAARNILLVSENFAKVSDFGMSRLLQESENYYKSTNPGVWPLRWYAPECLLYYKFTSKSDVWSFGITMWEALSHGKKPYKNMTGRQIIEYLEDNKRLEKPFACSEELFEIMLKCWKYNADERPSFNDIYTDLTTIYEVSVLPPLMLKSM